MGKPPCFTVQKHQARQLHYDFRLEIGGVLKSWAIPKGPSMDPRHKRLAVRVEDHDLDYALFEGIIEEGQYGAGPVLVWDAGTFQHVPDPRARPTPEQALAAGKIELILKGKKLKGGFILFRLKGQPKNWLLVKKDDRFAKPGSDILETKPLSALSGKNIEDLEREAKAGRLNAYRCGGS